MKHVRLDNATDIKGERHDPSPSAASQLLPLDARFPTVNISITRRRGSCDFDEGEDGNKELSAASSPDDESFYEFPDCF